MPNNLEWKNWQAALWYFSFKETKLDDNFADSYSVDFCVGIGTYLVKFYVGV